MDRLALGTAQFGFHYGIANAHGQVAPELVSTVLRDARASGMDMIDTASVYGESEQRLGEAGVGGWRVVTKLPSVPCDCPDLAAWMAGAVGCSLKRLGIQSLYGLLLHRPMQLLETEGKKIHDALVELKRTGLVEKIGYSIYDPEELDALVLRFPADLVQAPFNILDRRMANTGWMRRLNELGVELHVRSVFLQGLLLMNPAERARRFARWQPLWTRLDDWLRGAECGPLEACIGHALSFPGIHRIVVGIDHPFHLREIILAAAVSVPLVPEDISSDDPDLLNPARWGT